ncbi:hypothetical protein SAY87_010048 [Trapa incisa]|uniref:Glycine-rich protein n=1 Tax=Trapa incisa TaxID=236973 RepID=A0AAN7JAM2_9MYRT|nr:hypothetical protein SAY87_010048 [Trapa incisa]
MKMVPVKPSLFFFLTIFLFLIISVPTSLTWASLDGSSKATKPEGNGDNTGGFFGPGGGFGIPGFGKGWSGGYGGGFGGPSGGYSRGGIIRPTVVCKERGPCYNKKLTCPAKCFTSFSRSGKGYGSGGGGGGCTMDCKKKCVAYC